MITYLSRYIPNVAELTQPLRLLTKKDVHWHWDSVQKQAFETLKCVITKAPILKFFDPEKPCVISVDSSKYALGAVLL